MIAEYRITQRLASSGKYYVSFSISIKIARLGLEVVVGAKKTGDTTTSCLTLPLSCQVLNMRLFLRISLSCSGNTSPTPAQAPKANEPTANTKPPITVLPMHTGSSLSILFL